MPPPFIEFATERLFLRQWRTTDLEPFAALNADPRVMEYFPSIIDRERSEAEEIVSFTALTNRRSRAVMERIGMHEDVAATFEHPNVPEGSPLREHCLYRLSCKEWESGE